MLFGLEFPKGANSFHIHTVIDSTLWNTVWNQTNPAGHAMPCPPPISSQNSPEDFLSIPSGNQILLKQVATSVNLLSLFNCKPI
jgi:hypothetical protein